MEVIGDAADIIVKARGELRRRHDKHKKGTGYVVPEVDIALQALVAATDRLEEVYDRVAKSESFG